MKNLRLVVIMIVLTTFLFSTTSCVVYPKSNNGQHNGWFKNRNNPHNQNNTNPGKSKGKSKNRLTTCFVDFQHKTPCINLNMSENQIENVKP